MHWTLRLGTALATLTLPANALAQATASPMPDGSGITAFFELRLARDVGYRGRQVHPGDYPASSFLSTNSKALVSKVSRGECARLASSQCRLLEAWRRMRFGRHEDPQETMPDETLNVLVSTGFNVVVGKEIKPVDCPKIDAVVSSLAPLPISHIAKLLVSMGGLAGNKSGRRIQVCPNS